MFQQSEKLTFIPFSNYYSGSFTNHPTSVIAKREVKRETLRGGIGVIGGSINSRIVKFC